MRPLHFARELLLLAAAFLLHAGETFAGVILTPEQLEAQPHKPGVVRFGFLKPMKAYGELPARRSRHSQAADGAS